DKQTAHLTRLEGVKVGDQVTELAEGVHEVRGVEEAARGCGGLDQGGGRLAVAFRQLETGEESRTALIDGGGIGLVAAILLGHIVLVRQRHPVQAVHDASLLASRRLSRHPPRRSFPWPRRRSYPARSKGDTPCGTCFPSRARRPSSPAAPSAWASCSRAASSGPAPRSTSP